MKRDRTAASGLTIDEGDAMLISLRCPGYRERYSTTYPPGRSWVDTVGWSASATLHQTVFTEACLSNGKYHRVQGRSDVEM